MNDPHVTALHYWVNHDDSVDYDDAQPLDFEDKLFTVHVANKKATISPKKHYASEEEAREAVEPFVRNWEFDAALDSGSSRFSLTYVRADVIDRNPTLTPSGVALSPVNIHFHVSTPSVKVTTRKRFYPKPPPNPVLNVDAPYIQAMLSRLESYYKRREPLATMAYFCLTMLENNALKADLKTNKEKQTRDHYAISRGVLKQVSRLSSEKGGSEARKVDGFGKNFTQEEKRFLIAAVQAFIRRAAEKESYPDICLPEITLKDLPFYSGLIGIPLRKRHHITKFAKLTQMPMTPYPAYKPSGVPWLGDVPQRRHEDPENPAVRANVGSGLKPDPTEGGMNRRRLP